MYQINPYFKALKSSNIVELLFVLSLAICPLFILTVNGWMTRIIVVSVALSAYLLFVKKNQKNTLNLDYRTHKDIKLLSLTFSLPLLAIFIGQSFRGEYSAQYYDSPLHILICILVIWGILRTHNRVVEWMTYSFPLVVLLGLASILTNPNLYSGPNRITTYAVGPLEFGSLSLTFGILSLISIKLHSSKSKFLIIYKLVGFCVGIYLSIASGSRTGWLAIPIITCVWIYFEHKKYSLFIKTFTAFTVAVLLLTTYSISTNVHQRVNQAFQEFSSYQWNPTSAYTETSVGERVSFVRIAVFLFEKKPLSGWGDGRFQSVINDPALNFAGPETKKMALNAGFHNVITANMVRSGIWGLFAVVALFLIPAQFFLRNLRSANKEQSVVAFLGIAFLICQLTTGLTVEILHYRYSASFFGLMLAIFCGQILYFNVQNSTPSNGQIP